MTNAEMLQLLRQRDNHAYQELRKYVPMFRKPLRQMGLSDEDQKDIIQESIIHLYEKLQDPEFILSSQVTTYLYSVCKNKGQEHLRKSRKGKSLSQEMDYQQADYENKRGFPDDEQIRDALRSLGYPCKELLAAFYFHKVRLKDLCDEMGYNSENSAKQAKFKCMKRLKKGLQPLLS
jgi:RNA polymerase sigma factor (sigma-70 family)